MKIIIFELLFILLLSGCSFKETEIANNQYASNNFSQESKIEVKEEQKTTNQTNHNHKEIITKEKEDTIMKNNNMPATPSYTNNDKELMTTFENMDEEVTTLLESNDESIKDKAKGVFISIVDFIFYGGEINGVTFDELTEDGKQQVLKIANTIDNKIENTFPNYKETISEKTKDAFNKASELIKKGANNINDFAKEKLGEENYNTIIEAKDDLVYYTKNAFSIIGNTAKGIWNATSDIREDASNNIHKGIDKLKDWYENFKK